MTEVSGAEHWDGVYAWKQPAELSWYEPRPTRSFQLIKSLNIAQESLIADVGCGESCLVEELLDEGFINIFAVDISTKALDKLRKMLGEKGNSVCYVNRDVTSDGFPVIGPLDVWHDRALLHFLRDETQRERYLMNLKSNLKLGGYVIFAEHSYSGPEYCSDLRLHRYELLDLIQILGDEFQSVESFKVDQSTPSGSSRNLIYSIFRRKSLEQDLHRGV